MPEDERSTPGTLCWPSVPRDLGLFPSPQAPWAGLHWRVGQLQVPIHRTKKEGKKQEEHKKKKFNCNYQILHQQMQTRPPVDKVLKTPNKITWRDSSAASRTLISRWSYNPLQNVVLYHTAWLFPKPQSFRCFLQRNKTKQMSVITGCYCSSSEWQCNTQTDSFSLD